MPMNRDDFKGEFVRVQASWLAKLHMCIQNIQLIFNMFNAVKYPFPTYKYSFPTYYLYINRNFKTFKIT